jgi:hypothetical protein
LARLLAKPEQEGKHMAPANQRLLDAWRELWGQNQAIIDAFDGWLYLSSPAHEIEFVNRHLAERLGYAPLGQKCFRVLYNQEHPCPWCPQAKVLRGETVRRKSVNPQSQQTYYQVATPFYLQGEAMMLVTIQPLPAHCPSPMMSPEPGPAAFWEGDRQVA